MCVKVADFEKLQAQNPFQLFDEWFSHAQQTETSNPNAMTLATTTAKGTAQARTVLLKSWDTSGFVFYTNNQSRKGCAMQDNAQAALLFYWKSLDRQILIQGYVHPVSEEQSAHYFHSRPLNSQINASVSQQSRAIGSIACLEQTVVKKTSEWDKENTAVPLPTYWRGYCLMPNYIEFWQEGDFRLHHRIAFTQHVQEKWQGIFLQP